MGNLLTQQVIFVTAQELMQGFEILHSDVEVFFHQKLYQVYIIASVGAYYFGVLGDGYIPGIVLDGVVKFKEQHPEAAMLGIKMGKFGVAAKIKKNMMKLQIILIIEIVIDIFRLLLQGPLQMGSHHLRGGPLRRHGNGFFIQNIHKLININGPLVIKGNYPGAPLGDFIQKPLQVKPVNGVPDRGRTNAVPFLQAPVC
jgi:hypothetical protein